VRRRLEDLNSSMVMRRLLYLSFRILDGVEGPAGSSGLG
jgi:hypothetical protein